ncbi:hypothetical protein KJ657_01060 [Patescibacteria group bacterium]|nr:hypothetical protein [Patescibacteria group bacterium]MBU1015656.1 hypothetical protein [Patescibacteria group bacterium]MBU1684769.1 hypothetical protein [Patescibacteria group bacterium]MBU1938203.1 hypothetical protein [Patescibacteria group bacterium]
MKNNELKHIEGLLRKSPQFHLSKKQDEKILKALDGLHVLKARNQVTPDRSFHPFMLLFKGFATVAFVVAIFFGTQYYFNKVPTETTAPAQVAGTYSEHIRNARVALAKLEMAITGETSFSFIAMAVAENEDSIEVDENLISDLTEEMVEETQAAIESLGETTETDTLDEALDEIDELQTDEIEVLVGVSEVIEGETVAETVAAALDTTIEQQEAISESIYEVDRAIEKGEKKTVIQIKKVNFENKRKLVQENIKKAVLDGKREKDFILEHAAEAKVRHLVIKEKRLQNKILHAGQVLNKSTEDLSDLVKQGATEEEISDFEEHMNRLRSAVEADSPEILGDVVREARKELEAKKMELKHRFESLSEEEKVEFKEKAEEKKEAYQERVEEFKESHPEVKEIIIEEKAVIKEEALKPEQAPIQKEVPIKEVMIEADVELPDKDEVLKTEEDVPNVEGELNRLELEKRIAEDRSVIIHKIIEHIRDLPPEKQAIIKARIKDLPLDKLKMVLAEVIANYRKRMEEE